MSALRIAVGGVSHESNSFAPVPADLAAFEAGGVARGRRLLRLKGQNLAIAGFIAAAEAAGATLARC